MWPQLLENSLSLLLLIITFLENIFETYILLHPLIMLSHLIVHLLDYVLAVWILGSPCLMGFQLEKHLFLVLLVDFTDLVLRVLDVLLALAFTLAYL